MMMYVNNETINIVGLIKLGYREGKRKYYKY